MKTILGQQILGKNSLIFNAVLKTDANTQLKI